MSLSAMARANVIAVNVRRMEAVQRQIEEATRRRQARLTELKQNLPSYVKAASRLGASEVKFGCISSDDSWHNSAELTKLQRFVKRHGLRLDVRRMPRHGGTTWGGAMTVYHNLYACW